MMGEIRGNKRIYPVEAGTATIGRIRDTLYGGAESCHHKREREIHLMGEQVTTTISEREEIHHRGAGNCYHERETDIPSWRSR
jgi:hypothetical protein